MTTKPAPAPGSDWRGLTLRQQVARLLVVRASGHASDGQRRYPRWELPNADLKRLLPPYFLGGHRPVTAGARLERRDDASSGAT